MLEIIKSEFQKSKRTTINKFALITPLFTLLICVLWGGGQNGAYNWWYVMFLPGMLSIISAQVITREKSLSYKGVLLYPQSKASVWVGKIIYVSILLAFSSLIFAVGIEVIGFLFGSTIPLKANMLATVILILTFLFTIPVSLFLTVQFNMFVAVLFNIGMTMIGVVSVGTNSILKFSPYAASSALMVPILHILPNGLPVQADSPLINGDLIVTDTIINIIVFIILTILTTVWFDKKEVK
ncbi:lantibiotic immunity ABC transporter MutE/EpiE family permease subunit [Acetivibrio mesophilus]|uniref:Lantibiotic immunity ABC transporter MutE/EpiE family permease subunit n=1 Tax=Acetivibrio mesophilus TaxID=2487273 RepID=A0A4V1K2K6_9FIRM|nr:lantibiotic immunity ABC transporter MutE/EpiE family permease subunit [Acetivibrio mesophilus]RXE60619.1 lantibiotic immunity ABC transporter MutE/EpiE family permease subunit [Acetivibrio mesophilus]